MNKILFLVLLLSVGAFTARSGELVKKEKKVTDKFSTNKESKLRITNQYGKVHINIWDKDEVSVSVIISASATSADKAQELLDDIEIQEEKSNQIYTYRTNVKRKKLTINNKNEMEINYTINMPAYQYLALNNRFGDVYIASHNGPLLVDVEYGAIKTGDLNGPNANIKVSFGSLNTTKINTGSIEARYSKVTVDAARKLSVNHKFGKTYISNTDMLTLSQDYGGAQLTKINRLKGHIAYSDFSMDKPGAETDLYMQYCSHASLGVIESDAGRISISAKFSKLTATIGDNAGLDVDINTKFGKVSYRSAQGITLQEIEEDMHTSTYRGKTGSGKTRVVMHLEYTNMSFK